MSKIKLLLISLAAVFAIGGAAVAPSQPVLAATTDDVKEIVTRLSEKETKLFSGNIDETNLSAKFREYATALRTSKGELDAVAAKSSAGFKEKIADINTVINKMATVADQLATAFDAGDQVAYAAAYSDFEAATVEIQTAAAAYAQYLADNPLESGDNMYILWFGLLIASAVCLVGALVMFFMTKNQHGEVPAKAKGGKPTTLKDVRRNVVIGAGIFVVGAAIPAVQYWWGMSHPKADGTFEYYILWYPLALGAALFVGSVFQYVTTYFKVKKSGGLKHADNAAEMAGVKIPKIGSKADKK